MSKTRGRKWWKRSGRRGFIVPAAMAAFAVVLIAGMSASIIGAGQAGSSGPADSAQPTDSPESTGPTADPSDSSTYSGPKLNRSTPTTLRIKAIGVDEKLLGLGLNKKDTTVDLPTPVTRAGWYKRSAAPGEVGVSVIVGYIRAPGSRAGVFNHLNKLHKKDKISVRRKDGKTAVFRVTTIKSYKEGKFPAKKLYRATKKPVLRLITCGGKLHPKDPPGNVVVSARLVDTR